MLIFLFWMYGGTFPLNYLTIDICPESQFFATIYDILKP